jgi:hypothetical protein
MTASLLHRRDHVVRTRLHDDEPLVEVPRARRPAWMDVAIAGAVVVAVVTTGAVTWDGSGSDGAGVVDAGTGTQGPVPDPRPGPVARPDR